MLLNFSVKVKAGRPRTHQQIYKYFLDLSAKYVPILHFYQIFQQSGMTHWKYGD